MPFKNLLKFTKFRILTISSIVIIISLIILTINTMTGG